MMYTLSDLDNFSIHALNGQIGSVKDFYFDDRRWVIRYLVVEVSSASNSYKVLLTPAVIKHLNLAHKTFAVDMSIEEIQNSPRIEIGRSASMQYEIDYLSYYGYAFYWGNNLRSSPSSLEDFTSSTPNDFVAQITTKTEDVFVAIDGVRRMYGDRHLRSFHEIVDYRIHATDDEIGHLQSVLVDEDTWTIQYCVADTSNWLFGHQVLITTQAIKDISWGSTKIYVDMTRQQVKKASLFDPSTPLNLQRELGVYLYHSHSSHAEDKVRIYHFN